MTTFFVFFMFDVVRKHFQGDFFEFKETVKIFFHCVKHSEKIRWRKRGQRNQHFFPPDRKFLFLFAREKKNNLVLHKNVLFSLEKKKVVYFSGRIVIRFSKKSDFFSVLEE